ncbi:MAG: PepSY domain-containing protein [Gammaproteobacteria bacterium]
MHILRVTLLLISFAAFQPAQANVFDIGGVLTSYILLVQTKAANEDDAAKRVREQTGGRVLGVETASKGGSNVYLVKVLLPSGTVRVVEVSGQ